MSHWEATGKSDEWYTPRYIFDALGCTFDLDVAGRFGHGHVPCNALLAANSLQHPWEGFVWMNPPFGGRNGVVPWLRKFCLHGNGIALVPDRTSAPWFQEYARTAHAILFMSPKVKFERPDGSIGRSPSTGTALLAIGTRGQAALLRAGSLGFVVQPNESISNQAREAA